MPRFRFFWVDDNIEHVEEHGITVEDFERIVSNPIKTNVSDSSDRLCAFGFNSDGRYTICFYEMFDELTVLPVTAYEVEQ